MRWLVFRSTKKRRQTLTPAIITVAGVALK
jgi:hypothetical protein